MATRTRESLASNSLVAAGLLSYRWERYNKHQFKPGERIRVSITDSFPKPKPNGIIPQYDLIARNGNRFIATPMFNDSIQDATSGVWKIDYEGERSEVWSPDSFIAWKEHQETPKE